MDSTAFLKLLRGAGFDFFTGVPCSILKGAIHALEGQQEVPYVPAVREDSAIGMAAGAYFGGKSPVCLMQNSGLGYCLNALASLNLIYDIPCLLVVSWRGYQGKDAPEHLVMGRILTDLLALAGIHYEIFAENIAGEQIGRLAARLRERSKPVALIVKKGDI
ncbi:MAG: thiamine pyrophosphate-binding protein [Planctomycetota bacterium]|nr:thiamine pyrophosphate-binding protein [Planctomycetota bacterium]